MTTMLKRVFGLSLIMLISLVVGNSKVDETEEVHKYDLPDVVPYKEDINFNIDDKQEDKKKKRTL